MREAIEFLIGLGIAGLVLAVGVWCYVPEPVETDFANLWPDHQLYDKHPNIVCGDDPHEHRKPCNRGGNAHDRRKARRAAARQGVR